MATMFVGGLWHGAGWTFVVWGGLHGTLLCITHGWHAVKSRVFRSRAHPIEGSRTGRWFARAATFGVTTAAWVLFRAESFSGALSVYRGMIGLNGVVLPSKAIGPLNFVFGSGSLLEHLGVAFENSIYLDTTGALFLIVLLSICWGLPNTQELMSGFRPTLPFQLRTRIPQRLLMQWRPTAAWGLVIGAMAVAGVASLSRVSEFLYYQF